MVASRRVSRHAAGLALVLVLGCGERDGQGARRAAEGAGAALAGDVVSTVNGRPIELAEVRALARDGDLAPADALRRLQAEHLLIDEALRRGRYADLAEVGDVERRASVHALLDAEVASVEVTDADVRAAYAKARDRFVVKERRRAVHVLVRLPEGAAPELDAAARDYAASVVAELQAAPDHEPVLAAHAGKSVGGAPVVAESIPLLAREGRLIEAFETAMFSLSSPGTVPAPVRTSYGWHAIRVIEIAPGSETPYEAAAETLRDELLIERKKARVDALLQALGEQHRPVIPQQVKALLAGLEL